MINTLKIGGYQAVVTFDPELKLFRGEFVELNGGADFYGESVKKLASEGARSLKIFLDICQERGIEPRREFSGKLQVRLPKQLHAAAAATAAARGISLNRLIEEAVEHETSAAA